MDRPHDTVAAELEAIIAPLAKVCAVKRFTFSWRVRRSGDGWHAPAAAGFPYIDGKLSGPHPRYASDGATPQAALGRIVPWLIEHGLKYRDGYTPNDYYPGKYS